MSVVLSEHLPLLAAAPDGIQKLRGLILELAVRGKLVPQDPKDEPASALLKRIAKERTRLEAEGKIKKSKTLPTVGEDEQPFRVSRGWVWCRLQDYYDVRDGTHDSPTFLPSGVPFLTSKNIYGGKLDLHDLKYISESDHIDFSRRSKVDREDILFAMIGSIGNPVIVDTDLEFSFKNMALFKYYAIELSSPRYLQNFLSVVAADMRAKAAGGVQSFVALGTIRSQIFALPPLAEQHRIVAKVDELMALCDRLEAEVGAGETAHAKLVETLLGTLTQSTDAGELATNWQRLAEHFDTLFSTESSLDALKQTILQLAVVGKLVPQDPNDEPASELLKRIAKERAKLEAEGKIKKAKPQSSVSQDERQFEIPGTWAWSALGNLGLIGSSSRVHQKDWTDSGVPFYRAREIVKLSQNGFVKNELYVSEDHYKSLASSSLVPAANDLMVTGVGTIGIPYIVQATDKFYFKDASVLIFKNHFRLSAEYLSLFMKSPYWIEQIHEKSMGTTVHTLTIVRANEVPVPLPPLAEQHRIVAKVDELTALCDRLKADLAESRIRQARLSATLIESALQAA